MGESGEAQASLPATERIDFTLERGRHRRFVGRDDVLARLDEWLLGPDDTGWVVTGGPGMGKSAILSRWLDRREAAGAAVPHHFVRRQVIDWDQPDRISASLAAQIEAMFPEQRDARARTLARWPSAVEPTARRYALRHALIHRVEASAWKDAWRLAADMSFLEAKCRELGAQEAEFDVERVAERCRASGDEVLRGRFGDLARALARESHWLHSAPEATAAQVWNRLRQLGWSADEIDQQLQLPAGSRFLRVRHVATRESAALVRDLVGHASPVTACAVTPDRRRVVSASDDRTLKVWDLASGRAEETLEGHTDSVTACAVTPDGRQVISASRDGTLKVWDLASGWAEATLKGHVDVVTACAVTPDGRRVISASDDKMLKVWDLHECVCVFSAIVPTPPIVRSPRPRPSSSSATPQALSGSSTGHRRMRTKAQSKTVAG